MGSLLASRNEVMLKGVVLMGLPRQSLPAKRKVEPEEVDDAASESATSFWNMHACPKAHM